MGGRVWFHASDSAPDNGANRTVTNNGTRPYIVASGVIGKPGNEIGYNAFSVNGGVLDEWWWSGNTVGIRNWNYVAMRGGNPGTSNNRPATGYFGNGSVASTWTGGMGGFLDWYWLPPSAPAAPSVSRASNGTSLTATTSGGSSNRVTYYQVALNGVTGWQGNGHNFTGLGAHTTYNVIARAGNEDTASGNSNTTVSYGIPQAVKNLSIVRSTNTAGRIITSWGAPDYAGASVNKYVMTRRDTVTNITTTVVDSNIVSFNDDGLIRGRQYDYTIYCVGNSSPGNGISSSVTGVMAPGVPSAPSSITTPVQNPALKIGRNVTIQHTTDSNGFGNAVTEYRIQLSTDDGATWKGWDNTTKDFTANGTYNVTTGSITYELLKPALTYKWRVYSVNSIGTGDTLVTSTGLFVAAAGKRYDADLDDFIITNTAKRYNAITNSWVDINTAKRYNEVQGIWEDLV